MGTAVESARTQAQDEAGLTQRTGWRSARVMSVMILALMAVESVAGLWVRGLYRDPPPVAAMLRAYDLVTLVIVVPALALALLVSGRLAQLVWLSALAYGVYNYAIYVFGTAFNTLFLIHVALFGLLVFALALGLGTVDVEAIAARLQPRVRLRVVAGLLLLLAAGLAGMWVANALRFAVTGELPRESYLVLPIAGVHLAYVLDLALFAPACALAGVLLWRRAAWGYVLATVMLLFGTVYQVSYLAALAFQTWADVPGASPFDPAEPVVIAVFIVGATLLLTDLRSTTRR
jgi:hypothetical protein